jgi:exodeoxyribonuclease V
MAREGRVPPLGRYGDSEVIWAAHFNGDPTEFDIVICGRNSTRRHLNHQIRQRLGFTGPLPSIGEKLLVLRNRHRAGLMNGELVTVTGARAEKGGFLPLTVATEDSRLVQINAPIDLLLTDDSNGAGAQGDPVTWGYAITGHKSQGSQWDNVLLFDESNCFRENRWRWLYTAITRAVERITVVR